MFVCACSELWGLLLRQIAGVEVETVRAPASLAGCLQGSEWNVSIRELSFSGVFVRVRVFQGRGSLGQSL